MYVYMFIFIYLHLYIAYIYIHGIWFFQKILMTRTYSALSSFEETIHGSKCEWTLMEKIWNVPNRNMFAVHVQLDISCGCHVTVWRVYCYLKPGDFKGHTWLIFLGVSGMMFLLHGLDGMASEQSRVAKVALKFENERTSQRNGRSSLALQWVALEP